MNTEDEKKDVCRKQCGRRSWLRRAPVCTSHLSSPCCPSFCREASAWLRPKSAAELTRPSVHFHGLLQPQLPNVAKHPKAVKCISCKHLLTLWLCATRVTSMALQCPSWHPCNVPVGLPRPCLFISGVGIRSISIVMVAWRFKLVFPSLMLLTM